MDALRNRRKPTRYFALSEFDLSYSPKEFDYVVQAWKDGASVKEMHDYIMRHINTDRKTDEVVLLLFDLSYNKIIKKRKGGLF